MAGEGCRSILPAASKASEIIGCPSSPRNCTLVLVPARGHTGKRAAYTCTRGVGNASRCDCNLRSDPRSVHLPIKAHVGSHVSTQRYAPIVFIRTAAQWC